MIAIYITLSVIDFFIASLAFFQFSRLYFWRYDRKCNRQKVFLCLIGASNIGYLAYFVLTPIAKCNQWSCWSHACGFAFMAVPEIMFLATFLLLLSFWLDLCHQATDKYEEEEEDDDYVVLPRVNYEQSDDSRRRCCFCWRPPRIRSRQKFVIGVIILICMLTVSFAILIWIGMDEGNSINSATLAQIYSDIFAVVILISGGGLAGYGLMLYHKMKRVRSDTASRDLRKVAILAAVSVVCFSLRAFLVLFTDVLALNILRAHPLHREQYPALLFLYYFIGESIPSLVVLWVLRDLPSRSADGQPSRFPVTNTGTIPEDTMIRQWVDTSNKNVGTSKKKQVLQ